jgi:hypothetical protein
LFGGRRLITAEDAVGRTRRGTALSDDAAWSEAVAREAGLRPLAAVDHLTGSRSQITLDEANGFSAA